ncbi:hypothetical protein XELAEV_18029337mg [Xenopus laevis]|uniref:Uncharacterized protein n=1 Tax=Xenopus laevis TaxID=8355 RepID=A0A974HHI6_XENLA|nr:hypothetical protein XELAEV_18029337mg [Xenopus laevis]
MAAILQNSARVAGQRRRCVQRALQLKLQRASVEESSMSDSDQGSFQSTSARMPLSVLKDTSRRYTWDGVFAHKVSVTGDSVMVPVCGQCRHKAYPAFHDVRGRCQQSCWIGPYVDEKIQGSPQVVLGLIAPMANEERYFTEGANQSKSTDPEAADPNKERAAFIPPESAPDLPAAAEGIIVPVAIEPEEGPSQEILHRGSQDVEKRTGEEQCPPSCCSNLLEGVSVNIPSQGPHTPPGREGPPPYSEASSKEGQAQKGVAMQSREATQGASSSREDPPDEVEDDGAINKPLFKLPHSFWAPKKISRAEEKYFWVLPGRANPEIFCRISHVQRVINLQVHHQWGYYMSYAPLWVYEQVEEKLDEWVVEMIMAKKKTRGKNPVPCYFSVDVPLPEGGTVEKPHPKYYISYEDTKMRFTYMI